VPRDLFALPFFTGHFAFFTNPRRFLEEMFENTGAMGCGIRSCAAGFFDDLSFRQK